MKRTFKLISAPALCALGVIMIAPLGAQAGEYCAKNSAVRGCGFSSLEQCQASVSGAGGTCEPASTSTNTAMAYQTKQTGKRRATSPTKPTAD